MTRKAILDKYDCTYVYSSHNDHIAQDIAELYRTDNLIEKGTAIAMQFAPNP